MATLAQTLGEFVAQLRYDALPSEAIDTAKIGFVDCIAVIIAGAREVPVQLLRQTLADDGGAEQATLYFSDEKMPAPNAAWINAAAGHILDYDDFARGHPSVVIVPALLAEAEHIGASGSDILTAYVAGYETWMNLVVREPNNYQMKGWHPTPLIGSLAAAAACANLRKLDAGAAASALGLAAAQTCGITASYGTMAKSLQVGKAAHTGVLSARLAARGVTCAADVLDGEKGFLRAVSPLGNVDLAAPSGLGQRWQIIETGLSIKRYPVCYCAHRIIDGAIDLRTAHNLDPCDVEKIDVTISDVHHTILKNHRPQKDMEARFSAEFGVAASLIAGRVGFMELADDFVQRPDVQALMARTVIHTNQDYDPEFSGFAMADSVRISMRDGTRLDSGPVRYPLGHAKRPLNSSDLEKKFLDCLATGNPALDARTLLRQLLALENITSIRELYEA
jgi:2-methylcitrate dehydratase PrpD